MTVAPARVPESLASGTLPPRSLGPFVTDVGETFAPLSLRAQSGHTVGVACLTGYLLAGIAFAAGGERLFYAPGLVESPSPESYRGRVEIAAQSGYRSRELKFRETNHEMFRQLVGQWVALEGETILAHGADPVAVVAKAREKGVRVPYVFYVEDPRDDAAWIGV